MSRPLLSKSTHEVRGVPTVDGRFLFLERGNCHFKGFFTGWFCSEGLTLEIDFIAVLQYFAAKLGRVSVFATYHRLSSSLRGR